MVGSNCGRFRAAGALICMAFLAGVIACAGSVSRDAPVLTAGSEQIEDVLVETSGQASRVTLLGPRQPVFTAFRTSDPERLVIELADVGSAVSDDTIPVFDGTVDEISISSVDSETDESLVRVEMFLSVAVDYDVRPGEGGLVVEMTALETMADTGMDGSAETESGEADPWTVTPEEGAMEPVSEVEETQAEPVAAVIRDATVLTSVDAAAVGEGAVIHLKSDGMLQSAVTFTLEDPARLVVDLPGVKSEVEKERLKLDASQVSGVRVGAHADKVRVVIDGGGPDAFDGRQVMPVATGLVIALGSGDAVEAAVAAAAAEQPAMGYAMKLAMDDEPMPTDAMDGETMPMEGEGVPAAAAMEPAKAPRPVTVYGVEFDVREDHDRVVVLGDAPADYLVYEPDPETVVLSIAGSVLDRDAAVRIAPQEPGPVSLVTAFEQPDVDVPEVRVVMKRAANLKPIVTRNGALLLVDFPRTGEIAMAPPVLAMDEDGGAEMAEASGMDAAALVGHDAMIAENAMTAPPASVAPGGSAPMAPMPVSPAAIDPPAAISILSEGGLMDGKEYVGRRISLDFKDVEVADVLRLIAEVSDLNVIAGDEVKGQVTIRLVDVPWDQALDVILLTKGLGFVRIGNVLRIAAADVISQEEELRLQERRAKEKLEDLVVKLQPVNYADVKDISKMVGQLLTPRGSVNVDNRTNTLILKDIASVIDEATALVKAVDTMTPQVMIEAKIVEANLDFSREFGSVWSFGTNPLTQSTLGGRDWLFTDGANGNGNNVAFGNGITSFPNSVANIASTVLDDKFNIEAQLQAAEVNGDGKVISSPRIVTLDNSEAKIEQGVSIPFQTFENGDAQLEFVDAVLQLKTTPHITSDKSIIMEIHVSRNAPDDSVFTLTGSPAIAKNQVETETLVKDGQTLVLGGIYVVDKSERQSRVPYLHKVPFLGNAFKSHEYSDSRKELLIFVTPRIVQTADSAS